MRAETSLLLDDIFGIHSVASPAQAMSPDQIQMIGQGNVMEMAFGDLKLDGVVRYLYQKI